MEEIKTGLNRSEIHGSDGDITDSIRNHAKFDILEESLIKRVTEDINTIHNTLKTLKTNIEKYENDQTDNDPCEKFADIICI